MGVFSMNTNYLNEDFGLDDIEMNEDYTTGSDMAIALVEARENEFAVLNAGIKQDVIAAMCEDWDERIAINEATASGVLNKVKEILKKLLEKLKSIFHAFIAKMESFFKDSYEFYKKYVAEIAKKNLTEFKIKCREFHVDKFNGLMGSGTTGKISFTMTSGTNRTFYTMSDDDYNKKMESDELGKEVIPMVFSTAATKACSFDEDLNNIASEIEEYLFEDAEERDDIGNQIITADWIGGLLSKKKFISDIKKINDNAERAVQKLINDLGKDITKFADTIGNDKEYTGSLYSLDINYNDAKTKPTYDKTVGGLRNSNYYKSGYGYSNSKKYATKGADQATRDKNTNITIKYTTYLQAKASKLQEAMTKAHSARLSCAKKAVAQAKKIFAAAVAYNPKKENYELYTAVGESAEFEAIMAME